MTTLIGPPLDRKDGRLKVTGAARYAAEFDLPGITHAVIIQSTITKGRIRNIDSTEAEKLPGVLVVLSYKNSIKKNKVPNTGAGGDSSQMPGADFMLQSDEVIFWGQHVAVVVAETLEQAQHAASLVKIDYETEAHSTDMHPRLKEAVPPKKGKAKDEPADTKRGDTAKAFAASKFKVRQTYSTPHENHNPMEMHATVANWEGEKLTVYDATQYISGVQEALSHAFSLDKANVRVINPFVGGGFGCKGATWPHVALSAMAAKVVNRPVRLMLTRKQMFTSVGYRSPTVQNLALAANEDGHITAISHDVFAQTPTYDEFLETSALATRMLYNSDTSSTTHRLVHVDTQLPTYMRAPGESTGVFALECALDELAYALKMDPLQLRLINYAQADPADGKPFSSKSLRECYKLAAEKFAWDRRTPKPRSMNLDGQLVGYGMATATYPTMRFPASARVAIYADGSVIVQSGTQDIGTGTYTTMSQTAGDVLGVDPANVRSQLGDSNFPHASVSGGSSTTASVCSAVQQAAEKLRDQLIDAATTNAESPLHGLDRQSITLSEEKLIHRDNPNVTDSFQQIVVRSGQKTMEATVGGMPGDEKKKYSMHAFGAVFAEVRVDPSLGTVRVPRIVAAYASGRIVNAKTARSQYLGGLTFGIGMALLEHTVTDHRDGRIVNANLADYPVPVNADIGHIDIIMVPEEDRIVNPIGVKGIGEIGIVGSPAAIANAIYHATGKRIRDLPITSDKLL